MRSGESPLWSAALVVTGLAFATVGVSLVFVVRETQRSLGLGFVQLHAAGGFDPFGVSAAPPPASTTAFGAGEAAAPGADAGLAAAPTDAADSAHAAAAAARASDGVDAGAPASASASTPSAPSALPAARRPARPATKPAARPTYSKPSRR